jgi:hypothetical protein
MVKSRCLRGFNTNREAFVSGDENGYLKISRATFLALIENTMQNPDANHNIAQILFNLSKGGKTDGNVAFLV